MSIALDDPEYFKFITLKSPIQIRIEIQPLEQDEEEVDLDIDDTEDQED